MLQVRVYSWLNLLCLLASLANARVSGVEAKLMLSQVIMAGLTFFSTHANGGAMILPLLAKRAKSGAASVAKQGL